MSTPNRVVVLSASVNRLSRHTVTLDPSSLSLSHTHTHKHLSIYIYVFSLIDNFGVDQELVDVDVPVMAKQWWEETKFYMENIVRKEERYDEVKESCQNMHKLCTAWAADERCESPDDKAYMETNCAPACRKCHLLIFEERCPWDPDAIDDAWQPGDLDKMFTRITTEPYYVNKYRPEILSKPVEDNEVDAGGMEDGPWMVLLNDFLTEEECKRLIELGGIEGYELSKDIGDRNADGTYGDKQSKYRTSTNAWCTETCYKDDATQAVVARMENVTGIPDAYSEYFQLLRYEVGQFYGKHHDYSEHVKERQEGVRILTVFFYLNDVEEGGGTDFPQVGVTVMPKRGSALLWPSTLDEAPHEVDSRTEHQALPVEKGVKYGCNAWVHIRDFKTPYGNGCAT